MEATMQLQPLRLGGVLDEQEDCVLTKQGCLVTGSEWECGSVVRHGKQAIVAVQAQASVISRVKSWSHRWLLSFRDKACSVRLHRGARNIASYSNTDRIASRGGTPDEQKISCKSGSYDAESVLAGSEFERCFRVHDKEIQSVSSNKAEVLVQERNFRRHHGTAVGHTLGSERFRVRSRVDLLLQRKDAEIKQCSGVPVRVDADDDSMAAKYLLLFLQQWGREVVSMAKGYCDGSYSVAVGGGLHV